MGVEGQRRSWHAVLSHSKDSAEFLRGLGDFEELYQDHRGSKIHERTQMRPQEELIRLDW